VHLGIVGLGKMGFNMRARIRAAGIDVTGFDPNPEVSDVGSLEELVEKLPTPRHIWVMVPAGAATDGVINQLNGLLTSGDLIVDGGNSRYTEDAAHAQLLQGNGIHYVDVGVSGGVWGRTEGYALMAGGEKQDIERLMPVFDALRPEGPRAESFVHAGGVGAGHYAKMIHNGVEYGVMQAYAEGYDLLEGSGIIDDVRGVVAAWQRGTVIRSWLLELLVKALDDDPNLAEISGWVEDSGEGRWTVMEAIDNAVPAPVITAALFARFASRDTDSDAMKAVAALRQQFGGHAVRPADD